MRKIIGQFRLLREDYMFRMLFLCLLILTGCSEIPSTDKIDKDIATIESEIKEAKGVIEKYSGGLLKKMAQIRLEVLKSTKTMLNQKKIGLNRYIPISYSINGKKYTPPNNKSELILELSQEIKKLESDLLNAHEESSRYSGGFLKLTSLMQEATVKNTIAFAEQRYFLLKHDVPYFHFLAETSKNKDTYTKPATKEDLDNL